MSSNDDIYYFLYLFCLDLENLIPLEMAKYLEQMKIASRVETKKKTLFFQIGEKLLAKEVLEKIFLPITQTKANEFYAMKNSEAESS